MPTFCRAGILVECCAPGVGWYGKSQDAPDESPNNCPDDNREKRPEDTRPPEPRDCDSCAQACDVVSQHSKQTDADDFAVMLVAAIAVAHFPCDAFLPHQHGLRNLNTIQPGENLAIVASERPLLI